MNCQMKPLFRACFYYAGTFIAGFVVISLLAYYLSPRFSPSPSGELYNKYLYYTDNIKKYDLLFIGDSRTFCAVQPELIDNALGSTSFNLAHWTNWLPTQYPLVRDLATQIPKETTVVLLVGHINFQGNKIFDKYPIGIFNIKEYEEMGFSLLELFDNMASFNPFLRFFHKRATIRTIIFQTCDRSLYTLQPHSPSAPCRYGAYAKRPAVISVESVKAEGKVRSLALYKNNGGYERIELDEAFFRNKQQIDLNKPVQLTPPNYDSRYIKLFKKILSSFKSAGTKLLVVEIEEAPYTYGFSTTRDTWRKNLRSIIKKEVETNGYPYITLPLENIPDAGYFDHNHLNSKGIALFTPMLTKALASHISTASPKNTQ